MLLYALTIFLSAFLLFQVQPMIARIILPWFGGSAAVWTTCMLFFQVTLVAGYLYAHFVARRLAPRVQYALHAGLLAASLLLLPILPSAAWKPGGAENPTLAILGLLAVSVGVPYLMLSTTSPLLQAWCARSGAVPYRLFALSNLGSMLALLSYPTLVEPWLPLRRQAQLWSITYALFVLLCLGAGWSARRRAVAGQDPGPLPDSPPDLPTRVFWVLLPACASTLLLAVTTHLTQDVAAIPFLWVLPLALYLLSFILCFDTHHWYRRAFWLPALAVALAGMTYMLWSDRRDMSLVSIILIWAAALLVCCMVCHGELARLKPHPRRLTSFYLLVSLGGALGGLFVGVFAPAVFQGYFELPIGIAATATLTLLVLHRDPQSGLQRPLWKPALLAACAVGLFVTLSIELRVTVAGYRVMARNFYGTLRVGDSGTAEDENGQRKLTNGAINHGEQWLYPPRRRQPTGYYCEASGVVRGLLETNRAAPQRVGVIGLGAGVLTVFSRPGDHYTFYELNPLVVRLARSEFTLLKENPAATDIVLGDGRLSLERQRPQQFDLLAVDAFSSDAIPIHLLTREAFELYFRHLKSSGLLAVHVSNRYLDLAPVVMLEAAALGKDALVVETEEDDLTGCYGTTWVLVAAQRGFFARAPFHGVGSRPPLKPSLRLWTDDYSNLLWALQ